MVASALAGGDFALTNADALHIFKGTARTLGGTVKAPSTLGTFLRSFRWGHVRQLDLGEPRSCWHAPGRPAPDPATRP